MHKLVQSLNLRFRLIHFAIEFALKTLKSFLSFANPLEGCALNPGLRALNHTVRAV